MIDIFKKESDDQQNIETNEKTPSQIKKNQILIAISTIGGILLIAILFVFSSNDKKPENTYLLGDDKKKFEIADLTSGAKAQDRWLQISEQRLVELDKIIKTNEQLNKQLQEKIEELEKGQKALADNNQEFETGELALLKEELKALKDNSNKVDPNNKNNNSNINQTNSNDPFASGSDINKTSETNQQILRNKTIEEINLSAIGAKTKKTNDIKNFLPAGSFAPAKVIEGVDASVGVDAQSDPRPIKFIVTGPAISSYNQNNPQKTDITGCIVWGAARGDLSSEKVYARFIKMTCSPEEGKSVTMAVEGHTAASGKAGIRGPIVSREGDFISKSFFAGVAGGIGKGASSYFTTPGSILGSQVTTGKPQASSILGQGLGDGLSSTGNSISDYMIKRAEQYQPVVTIAGGIDVELNFDEGVYIDGTLDILEDNNKTK
jgi:conjugal transfer pilus assembly protein TraB